MSLNNLYHESFKKWLKGKCSVQSIAVSNWFEEAGIRAEFDERREVFIIYPHKKEYPKAIIEGACNKEEVFNRIVTEMLQPPPSNE